ncbi:MAG TPA: BON domain-containing protein [Acetobacteraceae bacterium]|nr:BON domain-containing protein [Acetobacteraceae bacterium]
MYSSIKASLLATSLSLAVALTSNCAYARTEWTDGGEDAQIAVAIRAELVRQSGPQANHIRFQVLDHVVYLHGNVSTPREGLEEAEIIGGVQGVKKVVNLTWTFNG